MLKMRTFLLGKIMDKNNVRLNQSSIREVTTCLNSECIMQMVANTHECYSVPGTVLGFYTSCINSFNPHNRTMKSVRRLTLSYRWEIQGTERPNSLPRSHMANKQPSKGVNSGSLAPEFMLLTCSDTCVEHYELAGKSGQRVIKKVLECWFQEQS